jgi:hypothetical protein
MVFYNVTVISLGNILFELHYMNTKGLLYSLFFWVKKDVMKWWKLRGEAAQTFKERMLGEGPWKEGEDADNMWLKMTTCVRKVASEVFGVSRGGKQKVKDTWWWNDEVQRAIREECFKRLHHDKSVANIEGYKIAKRVAKRAVSIAKGQAYDDLYQRLGTK